MGIRDELELEQAKRYLAIEQIDTELQAERDLPRLQAELRAEEVATAPRHAHEDRARDLRVIEERHATSIEGHRKAAAAIVRGRDEERIPDEEFASFRKHTSALLAEEKGAREVRKLRKAEERAASAYVTKEPGPYDAGSPHSWVRDTLFARDASLRALVTGRGNGGSDMTDEAVQSRLKRHAEDVARALRKGDAYGKRVREIMHEQLRCEDENLHRERVREQRVGELRSFGTDGGISATSPGEAASFVPPNILLKAWAGYRTPYASFANQCKQEDMPAYGLNLYVPHVTGAMEVTSQTEGSAIAEKAPTAGLIKGAVVNKSGQVEVSQVFLDRVGPGIGGDEVLFAQLKMQVDTEVDSYALNQALAEAQVVTNGTATFSFGESSGGVGGFLNDMRKGKNLVATKAGTRLKATHLFAPSMFTNFIEAWGTTIGGPVWSPTLDDNRLPIRSEGDMLGEGYSGYVLSQLAVFSDDNLPNYGTTSNYEVVVADPATVLLFRSPPVFACYPETYSTTLDAALTARVYCGCVPRWPEGAAVLTGAMYKSSLFA
jgi:hypothetical protein